MYTKAFRFTGNVYRMDEKKMEGMGWPVRHFTSAHTQNEHNQVKLKYSQKLCVCGLRFVDWKDDK